MNFRILRGSNPRTRDFARIAFEAFSSLSGTKTTRDGIEYQQRGFFYIGEHSGNLDIIVNTFGNGYAAPTPEEARLELSRCLERESAILPEIRFCEGRFDNNAIKKIFHWLENHPALSVVPFVLVATDLSEKALNYHRKNRFADEIIFPEKHNSVSLLAKVRFCQKIKKKNGEIMRQRQAFEPYITSLNAQLGLLNSGVRILNSQTNSLLKRCLDIAVAGLALILLLPLFALIALAIRLESKGPVFYIAKRAGRGFRIFDFYKFRTMRVGADTKIAEMAHLNQYAVNNGGPIFLKIKDDPRITRVGNFLRNSSLEELPQLLNVLLGDMSLVGNRPLPLYEAATLTTDQWAKRFMAPAGITGLWQIKKRGKEDMSVEERIGLDIDYADRNNFMYDLWIMVNTPSALMQKTNA